MLAEELSRRFLRRIDDCFTGLSKKEIIELLKEESCPWHYSFVYVFKYQKDTDLEFAAEEYLKYSAGTPEDKGKLQNWPQ